MTTKTKQSEEAALNVARQREGCYFLSPKDQAVGLFRNESSDFGGREMEPSALRRMVSCTMEYGAPLYLHTVLLYQYNTTHDKMRRDAAKQNKFVNSPELNE